MSGTSAENRITVDDRTYVRKRGGQVFNLRVNNITTGYEFFGGYGLGGEPPTTPTTAGAWIKGTATIVRWGFAGSGWAVIGNPDPPIVNPRVFFAASDEAVPGGQWPAYVIGGDATEVSLALPRQVHEQLAQLVSTRKLTEVSVTLHLEVWTEEGGQDAYYLRNPAVPGRISGLTWKEQTQVLAEPAQSPEGNALRSSIEDSYGSYSQMWRISLLAIEQAEQEATRRGEPAEGLSNQTVDLVNRTQAGMHGFNRPQTENEKDWLWWHQDLNKLYAEGREALEDREIIQDDLSTITQELLARPWLRLDELEWAIVSALIFREVFEFGERIKEGFEPAFARGMAYGLARGNLRKMGWKWLQVAAVLWAIRWGLVAVGMWGTWLYVESHQLALLPAIGYLASSFLVLVWLCGGLPVGGRAKRERTRELKKLLAEMRAAYGTLKPGAPLSPNQIRAALLSAQEKGAVWPSAALALLDRAALRDPPVWMF